MDAKAKADIIETRMNRLYDAMTELHDFCRENADPFEVEDDLVSLACKVANLEADYREAFEM